MALRVVGKLLSQSAVPRLAVARALSANAGPRERIWNCSKETTGEVRLDCLKDMLVDGDIQLFDVREPYELASTGRIPKSTNIPLNEIPTAFRLNPDEFKAKYGVPKPRISDENLIFHCQSGKRAKKAVEEVQQLGYEKANKFSGGWSEWEFYIKRKSRNAPHRISTEH